ncbi:MAG: SIMPL domain-containing protein [Verrucomicrobiae bacterium]|nr:SIMPL domain-containing protein [Verrucomicrobiae bacterium]
MTRVIPFPVALVLTFYLAILVAKEAVVLKDSFFPQRMITVQGRGEVSAAPDAAVLLLTVVSEDAEAAKTQKSNSERANAVYAMLTGLGIEKKAVQTTQYNLEPVYSYIENRPPDLTGFRLSQTISVKVKDFDKMGPILAEAVKLGVNRTDGPFFEISDPELYREQARKEAFAQAKAKALSQAAAAGVKLGVLVSFQELGNNGSLPPMTRSLGVTRAGLDESKIAPPNIEPGSQDLSVVVDVVYEIR